MADIIDFNTRRITKDDKQATREEIPHFNFDEASADRLFEALAAHVATYPQSDIMTRMGQMLNDHFSVQIALLTVAAQIEAALKHCGLSAEGFAPDQQSVSRFLGTVSSIQDLPQGDAVNTPRNLWNGPRFDHHDASGTLTRVATSVMINSDKVLLTTFDILRLKKGAKDWEKCMDGEWLPGPPADCFDQVDFLRGHFMPGTDWLEDDDEDWDDEDWDEDWDDDDVADFDITDEDSLFDLGLTPGLVGLLHGAGIDTVEDLIDKTAGELLAIRGIGRGKLDDIEFNLELIGRSLRED